MSEINISQWDVLYKKIISGCFFMLIGFLGMMIPVNTAIPIVAEWSNYGGGGTLWNLLFQAKNLNLKAFFIGCILLLMTGIVLVLLGCFQDKKH